MSAPKSLDQYADRMQRVTEHIDRHLDRTLDLDALATVRIFRHFIFTGCSRRGWAKPWETICGAADARLRRRGCWPSPGWRCSRLRWRWDSVQPKPLPGHSNPDSVVLRVLAAPAIPTSCRETQSRSDKPQVRSGAPGQNAEECCRSSAKCGGSHESRHHRAQAHHRRLSAVCGPLRRTHQRVWQQKVYPWMAASGLLQQPRYGVSHDDPNVVAPEQCRYDADARRRRR